MLVNRSLVRCPCYRTLPMSTRNLSDERIEE
jgi:hypothetical protein